MTDPAKTADAAKPADKPTAAETVKKTVESATAALRGDKAQPEGGKEPKAVNGLYVIADFENSDTGQTVKAGDPLPENIATDAARVQRLKDAGAVSEEKPRAPAAATQRVAGGTLTETYVREEERGHGDVGADRVDNSDRATRAAADVGQ